MRSIHLEESADAVEAGAGWVRRSLIAICGRRFLRCGVKLWKMICELSDGDPVELSRAVPKYVKLEMYEGKYGFLLQPVCLITRQKVEINRVRIPEKRAPRSNWHLAVRKRGRCRSGNMLRVLIARRQLRLITFDPETTYQEAQKHAASVVKMYENWEEGDEFAQFIRMAEPRISILPQKPSIQVAKENPQLAQEIHRWYEIAREERSARFKVLSSSSSQNR